VDQCKPLLRGGQKQSEKQKEAAVVKKAQHDAEEW
jgi:hypothetical protein